MGNCNSNKEHRGNALGLISVITLSLPFRSNGAARNISATLTLFVDPIVLPGRMYTSGASLRALASAAVSGAAVPSRILEM